MMRAMMMGGECFSMNRWKSCPSSTEDSIEFPSGGKWMNPSSFAHIASCPAHDPGGQISP